MFDDMFWFSFKDLFSICSTGQSLFSADLDVPGCLPPGGLPPSVSAAPKPEISWRRRWISKSAEGEGKQPWPHHPWIDLQEHVQETMIFTSSGWWFQPIWKILVSWDYYSQYIYICIHMEKNVRNHQSVICSHKKSLKYGGFLWILP